MFTSVTPTIIQWLALGKLSHRTLSAKRVKQRRKIVQDHGTSIRFLVANVEHSLDSVPIKTVHIIIGDFNNITIGHANIGLRPIGVKRVLIELGEWLY